MPATLQETISQYFNFGGDTDVKSEESEYQNAKYIVESSDASYMYESWNNHVASHPHYDYDSGVYDDNDSSEEEPEVQQKKINIRRRTSTLSLPMVFMFLCSVWIAFLIQSEKTDIFEVISKYAFDKNMRNKTVTYTSTTKTIITTTTYSESTTTTTFKNHKEHTKMDDSIKSNKLSENDITNFFDQTIIELLSEGEKLFKKKKFKECETYFDKLVTKFPKSPRALYGKAKCIEKQADKKRSEPLLYEAFEYYEKLMDLPNVPIPLIRSKIPHMAERCIKFGQRDKAVSVYQKLSSLMPNDLDVLQKLGVAHLYIPNYYEALEIFLKIFKLRSGGWIKVHIGYTYKMLKNYTEAIKWLEEGLQTEDDGVHTSRFYFSLADTYFKIGEKEKAYKIYEEGAARKVFLSKYQRSLYNSANHLRAQPWWTDKEAELQREAKYLRLTWRIIHDEAMALVKEKDVYYTISPQLIDYGNWRIHTIARNGKKLTGACATTPKICEIIDELKTPLTNQRADITVNILDPMTHIWPHTGPTNCRLRLHLAISVPREGFIRVADHEESWRVGRTLLFDDSFEYEMWNNSTNRILVYLSIDFWHPDVPEKERKTLHPIK